MTQPATPSAPPPTAVPDLERFAYVASHDMAEPLRMVSAYLQLLSDRYRGQLDEDADDFIAFAIDGAKRMEAYLEDMRTYSRIGRLPWARRAVDARSVVQRALERHAAEIDQAGIEVAVAALPDVWADADQLGHVFDALISNAVKFRAPEEPRIEISATIERSGWWFTVADNGIGMEPGQEERAFAMLERLNGQQYPGTGMGLAIARKAVELHGGAIWVERLEPRGSAFHFVLSGEEPTT
jgi:light-regulated signal transduction histidine kinase (bacteriophytochrome)